MKLVFACLLAATPVCAEPMTGAEFEAYVTGKTLDFAINGEIYGREEYLPNRRVRWAFSGDKCLNGFWYERAPREICFIYDDSIDEQCWNYSETPEGMIARFLNDPSAPDVYAADESDTGLFCPGPEVGV
jgi:hypothetical protein